MRRNNETNSKWTEIVKLGDYRYTQGPWERYTPPRALKAEQRKIKAETWRKRNKVLWQRVLNTVNKETQNEPGRKKKIIQCTEENQKPNKTSLDGAQTATDKHHQKNCNPSKKHRKSKRHVVLFRKHLHSKSH